MTTAHEPADGMDDFPRAVGRAAHDLNNLCASILGFAALTQESLPADSPLHAYLAEVLASAEKTAALAEHLRTLSRRGGRLQPAHEELSKK
jgi:signal transduction histidine kinase